MATITSAGTGNSNATATWVGGVVPDADDDVVIDSGHTVTQNANATFNSLALNGTFVASSSYSLTIDGENSSGQAFIANSGTFTHGNGTVTITTPAATNIYFKTENPLNNLIINHSSAVVYLAGNPDDLKCEGNLTITAGTLKSTNSGATLDVDGDAIVTGTLDWSGTSGGAVSLGSLRIDGTYSATSGTTIITSERSNGRAIDIVGTYTHNSGTLEIQTPADTDLRCPSSSSLNNLTINHASCIARPTGDNKPPIAGDLTITAGTFNTLDSDGINAHDLTVTGDCYVAGTLTGNASAISLKSLEVAASGKYNATSGTTTITGEDSVTGYAWDVNGTDSFDNNDGTVLFDLSAFGMDTHVRTGQSDGANSFHHLTILLNASTNTFTMRPNAGTVMTVEGDLTVQEGVLQKNTHSNTLTVTGDVSIESGGKIDATSASGANNFGSLKIASGGTYTATSGTTTITNKNSSNYMFEDLVTFTHNNGTVHFKADTSSGTWYAVKGHSTEDTTEFYNVTTERVGSSTSNYRVCVGGANQFFTVRNNLTVGANCKIFSANGSSKLRHYGLAILNGELDLDSFTDIEMGAVTINSGGTLEFDNGSITIKAESFRNIGGTINA